MNNKTLTGEEIKQAINNLELEISELFTSEFFTLNDKISVLNQQIRSLQQQCPHQFEKGRCIWCNTER